MILGPHALPGAYFDTLACVALLQRLGDPAVRELEAHARGLMARGDQRSQDAGRQLLEGILHARKARVEWVRLQREGSGSGTTEHLGERADAWCAGPQLDPGGTPELSVRDAVAELLVSDSLVRRWCREGIRLRGRRGPGGAWLIDAASVAELKAARRPVT